MILGKINVTSNIKPDFITASQEFLLYCVPEQDILLWHSLLLINYSCFFLPTGKKELKCNTLEDAKFSRVLGNMFSLEKPSGLDSF
jgi:hypothetical protein